MTALIVSGGQIDLDQLWTEICKLRKNGGMLIAADSGLEALYRLQKLRKERETGEEDAWEKTEKEKSFLLPETAVGDFDSVSAETLEYFQKHPEICFERHRPEKNESDTELAFTIAQEKGIRDLTLMGATGTRMDHVLSNIQLLEAARKRGLACRILDPHNRIRLVAGRTVFRRSECPYPYISFVPLTMEVTHIRLTGFKYPLEDHHMILGVECGHCISNEIAAEEAVLDFEEGLMLAVESRD